MRTKFVKAHGYEIAVYDWGVPAEKAVFCVHGLGGHGRNFKTIADALADKHYVIAIDLIGRGRSQWAADADEAYNFEQYSKIVDGVLTQLNVQSVHWLGVSMGGALGISMCAGRLASRTRSLVLNDIGPILDTRVRDSIFRAVSNARLFESFTQFARDYEALHSQFGMKHALTSGWQEAALLASRRDSAGRWTYHYDPTVARQLKCHQDDFELSGEFSSLHVPILLFRGSESDVLSQPTVSEMLSAQPQMRLVTVPGVGHAPLLNRVPDLQDIREFISNCNCIDSVGAES